MSPLSRHFSRAAKARSLSAGEGLLSNGTVDESDAAREKTVNVVDHPFAQGAIATLRDKNTPPDRFRSMSNLLLTLLTIEATRDLPTRERPVDAVDGAGSGRTIGKPVLFLSVSHSGLGLIHNLADTIPGILVGSISIERTGGSGALEPRLHFAGAPSLDDAHVILFQTVVATGRAATVALDLLRRGGAKDPILLTFLISFQGLNRIHGAFAGVPIWTGAIDSDWNSARGRMPGFGKFSERMFG
jgi:uracil phosphoribosyltransferase